MGFKELEFREGVQKMGKKLGHFPFGVDPRPYPLKGHSEILVTRQKW